MISSPEHQAEISEVLNQCIMEEDWQKAKEILENELRNFPEDHFLLTQMGEVYYEMRDYNKALIFTQKAVEIAPNCPLALNNHATVLFMHERYEEAQQIWKNLLKKGVSEIAQDECAEGIRWAKSLLNDIRFRVGDTYLALGNSPKALQFYQLHLENRQRGQFSNFSKKEILEEIREIEK